MTLDIDNLVRTRLLHAGLSMTGYTILTEQLICLQCGTLHFTPMVYRLTGEYLGMVLMDNFNDVYVTTANIAHISCKVCDKLLIIRPQAKPINYEF